MTYQVRRTQGHDQSQLARTIRAKLDRPVVILGLMGSGKSRLGRMLARAIDVAFYDCDAELEFSAGRSAREVYEQIGPAAFEQAENRILQRLITQKSPAVIATGGGAAIPPALFDQVLKDAVAVWVRADLDLMVMRVERGLPRPQLIGREARPILQTMIDQYHPVFARAPVVVDTHDGPAAEVMNQALSALGTYLDRRN